MKKLVLFLAISILSLGALSAKDYSIDVSHSQVDFKIKHLSVSNVSGNFSKFDGVLSAENGKLTALNGEVNVDSINTNNKKRDEHIKDPDFFDVKKSPKAFLKLVSVSGDVGTFDLIIKDIKKSVKLDIEVFGTSKNPQGKEVIGLNLSGKINRKDFNIATSTPNASLGEEVKISIDIEGIEK